MKYWAHFAGNSGMSTTEMKAENCIFQKQSIKWEKPQGVMCFRVPVAQDPFYSFLLLPTENEIISNIISPYMGLLEMIKVQIPCFR